MTRPSAGYINFLPVTSQNEAAGIWSLFDVLDKRANNTWPNAGYGLRLILVAGGGGGYNATATTSLYTRIAGGGGAGGVLFGYQAIQDNLSAPVTIGAGGTTTGSGSSTTIDLGATTLSALGGGRGAYTANAQNGGSGGGGAVEELTGNTFTINAPGNALASGTQGNPGAEAYAPDNTQTNWLAGGGGGAGATPTDQNGGIGIDLAPFIGTTYWVGGGGGGSGFNNPGAGGQGGGGNGAWKANSTSGDVNTGGGGGATGTNANIAVVGGTGGSGVLFAIYSQGAFSSTSGGTLSNVTIDGRAYSVRKLTSSGTLTLNI